MLLNLILILSAGCLWSESAKNQTGALLYLNRNQSLQYVLKINQNVSNGK